MLLRLVDVDFDVISWHQPVLKVMMMMSHDNYFDYYLKINHVKYFYSMSFQLVLLLVDFGSSRFLDGLNSRLVFLVYCMLMNRLGCTC